MLDAFGRRLALTRRGMAVLALAVAAVLAGHLFGGRSLNAVVMPAAALLVVGAVGVARTARPRAERIAPSSGFTGETVRVELDIAAPRPVALTVSDDIGAGLAGDTVRSLVPSGDGSTVAYELELTERGVHTVGPAAVTVTDVFGLWEREFVYDATDTVVAFPRVHPLYEGADLLSGYVGLTDEREQFDTVREYEHGDGLRDINWKASAKRNEYVVTEYAGEGATNRVTVGVERPGDDRSGDAAAEAAASVVAYLLDAGLSVGLTLPGGDIDPGAGPDHRRRLFDVLARLEAGGPPVEVSDADAVVRADAGEAYLDVGSTSRRFGDLVAAASATGTGAVAA